MKEIVQSRRITICEVTGMLQISFGSVQSIMKDNMRMCGIACQIYILLIE
jgi:hypothetical protein